MFKLKLRVSLDTVLTLIDVLCIAFIENEEVGESWRYQLRV